MTLLLFSGGKRITSFLAIHIQVSSFSMNNYEPLAGPPMWPLFLFIPLEEIRFSFIVLCEPKTELQSHTIYTHGCPRNSTENSQNKNRNSNEALILPLNSFDIWMENHPPHSAFHFDFSWSVKFNCFCYCCTAACFIKLSRLSAENELNHFFEIGATVCRCHRDAVEWIEIKSK